MRAEKTKFHIDKQFLNDPISFGDISLLQIGRRYCEPGAVIGEHRHRDLFEITIVTAGEGVITTNDDEITVHPGDIHLSFPNEKHNLRTSQNEKFEYDFFSFQAKSPYDQQLRKITESAPSPPERIIRDERISYLVALAISELSRDKIYKEELMSCLLRQVIIYIIRNFNDCHRDAVSVSNADILCQNIMSYIDTHIYSISNLFEIADEFKYNYSYLSDLFKRTTGNTLSDYHRGRRLDTASTLIAENKKTVGEIAELLGYSTPFAFSAAFKARFGLSPRAYRTQMNNKNKEI